MPAMIILFETAGLTGCLAITARGVVPLRCGAGRGEAALRAVVALLPLVDAGTIAGVVAVLRRALCCSLCPLGGGTGLDEGGAVFLGLGRFGLVVSRRGTVGFPRNLRADKG